MAENPLFICYFFKNGRVVITSYQSVETEHMMVRQRLINNNVCTSTMFIKTFQVANENRNFCSEARWQMAWIEERPVVVDSRMET